MISQVANVDSEARIFSTSGEAVQFVVNRRLFLDRHRHGRLIGPVAWSVEAYKPEAQDVTSKVKSGGGDAP